MAGDPLPYRTQHWSVGKPAATSRRGVVVAQSHDAACAGVAILDAGGNAADAAIATAFALAAVEPWNSGLGGVGFALIHPASEPVAHTIDFGPVSPAALDPSAFSLTGALKPDLFAWPGVVGDRNIHGALSACVPSAVAGYAHLHARHGRLPMRDIMAPAIAFARRGLPADWFTTLKIANAAATLRLYAESARIYLPDGLPPVAPYQGTPGFLPLGRLADTLDLLARVGLHDFYDGDIATSLLTDIHAAGGVIDQHDLRQCKAVARPADTFMRLGDTIQCAGGLTAAPAARGVLTDISRGSHGARPDAAWFAALATEMRNAYAQRLGTPADGCTTHLNVCDADGTMVAMTSTLLSSMGSRLVLPGTGVLLNNGVMWFDPKPGRPNSIASATRPLTNMCPIIVQRDGVPVLALGASGGRRIMAAVVQILAFTQDFGMTLSDAAHHPRIDVSDAVTIHADRRLGDDIIAALRAVGPTECVEHAVLPINFGCPSLLARQNGLCTGIADVMSPWSDAVAQA